MQILPTFEPKKPKTAVGYWMTIATIIGVILITPFLWWKNRQREQVQEKNLTAEQRVLQQVSRSVDLGTKQPRLQYITDPTTERTINPTVYAQAEAGDWMIFTEKNIYLYRESQNKILLISTK